MKNDQTYAANFFGEDTQRVPEGLRLSKINSFWPVMAKSEYCEGGCLALALPLRKPFQRK
jgi:hypothetical protein